MCKAECLAQFPFGQPHVLLILLLPPPRPPPLLFLFLFWCYSPRWDLLPSKIVSFKFWNLLNKTYFLWSEIFSPTPNPKPFWLGHLLPPLLALLVLLFLFSYSYYGVTFLGGTYSRPKQFLSIFRIFSTKRFFYGVIFSAPHLIPNLFVWVITTFDVPASSHATASTALGII